MGNIGRIIRKIDIEPVPNDVPVPEPVPVPAEPAEPEQVPAGA